MGTVPIGTGELRTIHSRVSWMLRPVDRSMTVSAPQRIAHTILSTSDATSAARVVQLRPVGSGLRAEDSLPHVGEGLHPARAVWAELAIVLGPDLALDDFFDVAAGADPVAAKLGQSSHDVDAARRVGVRPA